MGCLKLEMAEMTMLHAYVTKDLDKGDISRQRSHGVELSL